MKLSRFVSFRTAARVSWTIPMTGLFDCGDTICFGTIQISVISARVSSDCGTCKFISSPSKSALYGDVQDKFNRNVEYGITLTLWPIIDILCRDGCRLKITTSPSTICRSTRHPYCKLISPPRLWYRRSIRSPVSRITYFAPGCSFGPFRTSCCSLWMLYGVTVSGYVNVRAILLGTPTSSRLRFGSPVMTVRAEKSTRLPMRFPRRRPSFPFKRARIDFTGRPVFFWSAWGWPAISLSIYVATWNCSNCSNSWTIWAGAPSCSQCRTFELALMISASLCVKSSSPRHLPSLLILGRTGGGGTGKTVMIIHSGLAYSSFKPIFTRSSLGICLKTVNTSAGVISFFSACTSYH